MCFITNNLPVLTDLLLTEYVEIKREGIIFIVILFQIALCLASLPLCIIATLSYCFPAYWIPDVDPRHNFARFLFFTFVFFLISLVIITMAELLAIAMPTEGIAVMLLGIIVPIFTLFAGFIIPRTEIPGWWIWSYWGSLIQYAVSSFSSFLLLLPLFFYSLPIFSYSVEAMLVEMFSGLTFHCKSNQLTLIPTPNGDQPYLVLLPLSFNMKA